MKLKQAQPIVIIRGTLKHLADGYLVCEKLLLFKINPADLPMHALLYFPFTILSISCLHVNCKVAAKL